MVKLDTDYISYLEVEKIRLGMFSPPARFMDEKYFYLVAKNMRLSNGLIFSFPLEIPVSDHKAKDLKELFNW